MLFLFLLILWKICWLTFLFILILTSLNRLYIALKSSLFILLIYFLFRENICFLFERLYNMITGFFGVPGCGKTTLATWFAQRELSRIRLYQSKYKRVYTNFSCKGCYRFDFRQLGVLDFSDALVIIDEITIDADNRAFKSFKQESVNFFVYHRHYNCDVLYFTQQWDAVDKKIRNLTQRLYRIKKSYILPFVTAKAIFRTCDINDYTSELVVGYRFPNLWEMLLALFHNKKVGKLRYSVFAPRLWKYFDSYCQPFKWAKWNPQIWN